MATTYYQPTIGGVLFRAEPEPPPPETINLLTVVPDGPLALVLTFDRAPAGAHLDPASYALAFVSGVGGYLPAVLAAVAEPDGNDYPHKVRLTLAAQCTKDDVYSVTVSGILGPCDEPLGTATAQWIALGNGPAVQSAASLGLTSVRVVFDEPVIGCDDPAGWAVEEQDGDPVVVSSVAGSGAYRTLTLAAPLVPVQPYTVLAPATTTSVSSNAIAEADRDAEFVVPVLTGRVSIRATGGAARCLVLLVMPPNQASEEV